MSTVIMETEENTQQVQDVPPAVALTQMVSGYWVSQAIYVAARLGVADLLAGGPKHVVELAGACGADEAALYRVMRMLAGVGVFARDAEGRFRLTPLSEPLRTGPGSARSMAIHMVEGPSWRAWGELLHTVRTGETAFAHANGSEVFPFYAAHPESAEPFNQAMTEMSAATAEAVVRAYDFGGMKRVVDVGGGHGQLLAAILKANPHLSGVVFDQPEVADAARERLAAEGLGGRCEAEGGDFFESVPEGGDAYLLKWIIHDWDDRRAGVILKNIHRAMPEGGRLLLVEAVVPEGDGPSFSKHMDVHMMVMTGGRERTESEYARLYADAGFRLTRVVPTESMMSIVEGVKIG